MKNKKSRRVVDINDARNNSYRKRNAVEPEQEEYVETRRLVHLVPRNLAQEEYVQHLGNPEKRIILAVGPAGTGKTYLAVLEAIKELRQRSIDRIIITRPAIHVENEKFGFLPGTIEEKLTPWLMPIMDIVKEYYSPYDIKRMMETEKIEISPLAFMRGRTFKNCIILLDEAQNTSPVQMKMILTRLGVGSRIVVTGDLEQSDHKNENGFLDFIRRVENTTNDKIAIARFTCKHIERDPIVKDVLGLYNGQ